MQTCSQLQQSSANTQGQSVALAGLLIKASEALPEQRQPKRGVNPAGTNTAPPRLPVVLSPRSKFAVLANTVVRRESSEYNKQCVRKYSRLESFQKLCVKWGGLLNWAQAAGLAELSTTQVYRLRDRGLLVAIPFEGATYLALPSLIEYQACVAAAKGVA